MSQSVKHSNLFVRLEQIASNLTTEGYRITGRLRPNVIALKHPNGNRMTLIANEYRIAYIKNGHFLKNDLVCVNAQSANPST